MSRADRMPLGPALLALGRCVGRACALIARRRVHQPALRVGSSLRFANGTAATIYRETVVEGAGPAEPCVLEVAFRLRWIGGWGHAVFRAESLLNTVLFVGFPGFVSKLWLAHDQRSTYRGLYEWDGADRAEAYVRALWWALVVVSEPDSIRHQILPGVRRDAVLAFADAPDRSASRAWWAVVAAR